MASVENRLQLIGERLRPATVPASLDARLCLAIVVILFILRAVLAATTDLAEDEAYYWLWSRHLAAGYYDHPPMIAYWIRAGTAIFGQTGFGIRFTALLSSLAASYLLYRASLSLFRDRSAAFLSVIWLNATILCNAAAILATPDTPLAFFAVVTLFALAKLIATRHGVWWLAAGAALGLAFMSKYTAVLLLPGLFLWMAASSEGRRWFLRPQPYLGALLAFLAIAPVVYWNYGHDWVSFAKQVAHGIKDKPASPLLSVAEFIGGQAGLATPLIFVFCIFGSFYSLMRGWRRAEPNWLLLGALTVPVFVFFIVHAAGQKIQPNWPAFIYPAAILAAVHGFLAVSGERPATRAARMFFTVAPWVGIAFSLAAFLQLGLGVFPINTKQDPTSRLKGWAKLGTDIVQVQRDSGAARILTDGYALTGELAFYGSQPDMVEQINERIRYAGFPIPSDAELGAAPALLIVHKGSDVSQVAPFFATAQLVTTVKRQGGLKPRDNYDVYLLTGYRGGLFGRQAGCRTASNQDQACN